MHRRKHCATAPSKCFPTRQSRAIQTWQQGNPNAATISILGEWHACAVISIVSSVYQYKDLAPGAPSLVYRPGTGSVDGYRVCRDPVPHNGWRSVRIATMGEDGSLRGQVAGGRMGCVLEHWRWSPAVVRSIVCTAYIAPLRCRRVVCTAQFAPRSLHRVVSLSYREVDSTPAPRPRLSSSVSRICVHTYFAPSFMPFQEGRHRPPPPPSQSNNAMRCTSVDTT